MSHPASTPDLNQAGKGKLPELIGLDVTLSEYGRAAGRLPVREALLAPNGFLHAASVIALADTLAGYGAMASLPDGAYAFTTVELKSNFLGTARDGVVLGEAVMVHGGRTTQLWDAKVWREGETRPIALFRCTQMLLYPR